MASPIGPIDRSLEVTSKDFYKKIESANTERTLKACLEATKNMKLEDTENLLNLLELAIAINRGDVYLLDSGEMPTLGTAKQFYAKPVKTSEEISNYFETPSTKRLAYRHEGKIKMFSDKEETLKKEMAEKELTLVNPDNTTTTVAADLVELLPFISAEEFKKLLPILEEILKEKVTGKEKESKADENKAAQEAAFKKDQAEVKKQWQREDYRKEMDEIVLETKKNKGKSSES